MRSGRGGNCLPDVPAKDAQREVTFSNVSTRMEHHLLGQLCALMCAVTWAFALVLFKQSTKHIPPLALNLFKNAVGLVLLLATVGILHVAGCDGFAVVRAHSWWKIGVLLLSGVIGIALADTIFFHALRLIGVGLISIVDCAYAPSVVLFSWLLLSERVNAAHYAGGALILVGVFLASSHKAPPDRTRRQIIIGMLLAPLAVALMAFGIVLATPVVRDFPLVWATTIRMAAGSVALVPVALVGRGWQAHWQVFRPSASWRVALPAAFLGAYLSMMLWIAGFKHTDASIAGILSQTSVIFATVLATLVLKESFDRRKAVALTLAVVGVVIVMLSNWLLTQWRSVVTFVYAG